VRVVLSAEAKADLIEIRHYISQDDRIAAAREIARIKAAIKILATGKADGPSFYLKNGEVVRKWLVLPYRIYYRSTGAGLIILHVRHHARRPIER